MDSKGLNKALRNYDSPGLIAALGNVSLSDRNVAREVVMALRQSSCFVIENENATAQQRRDDLIENCRKLLASCTDKSVTQSFEDHIADAKIVEFGYREIFRTIRRSDIWAHSPDEQAWGILVRAEREFAHVYSDLEKELTKLKAEHSVVDPRQLKLRREDGIPIDPDAVFEGLVKNAGDILVTLGYIHNWFDKNSGALIIPAEMNVSDDVVYKAGTFSLAASQWRRLAHAWDRSRLLGARLRLRDQAFSTTSQDRTLNLTVLEATACGRRELLDRIAIHRLLQVFLQGQKSLEREEWSKGGPPDLSRPIPLATTGFLSPAERLAAEVLRSQFHIAVDDERETFGGLPLNVWLRGYAHYAKMAEEAISRLSFSCLRLSERDLLSSLVLAGLSEAQALTFVQLTTFGKNAKDLFDAPLLRSTTDGSYVFFVPAYYSPVLGVIILSRISALNRRRNEEGEPAYDCTFGNKGRIFEEDILSLFTDDKIPAYGFKYKVDGSEYECDVAALIKDTLFVFECKNRSLPMGHTPSIYYFDLGLDEAKQQVKRIAKHFAEHPEIVHSHFGKRVKWKRIVPVVLHALPWSCGESDGVFIYDASALAHLIGEGFTSVSVEFQIGIHRLLRRHRYPLRKGKTPTAKELEREMKNPSQLRISAIGWEQLPHPVLVSDTLVFWLPEWSQRPVTVEERMIALGSSPEEAAQIMKHFNAELPKAVEKIRDAIQNPAPKHKTGEDQQVT